MAEKYEKSTVKELQGRLLELVNQVYTKYSIALLQGYNLSTTGKKEELLKRLVHYEKKKELEELERELDADLDDSLL